jgi:hypothetical protein
VCVRACGAQGTYLVLAQVGEGLGQPLDFLLLLLSDDGPVGHLERDVVHEALVAIRLGQATLLLQLGDVLEDLVDLRAGSSN